VTEGPIHLAELDRRSVDDLAGVGPKKLAALRSVGINTILDLLMFFPRKYLDRTHEARIRDLTPGDTAMVLAKVQSMETRRGRGGKSFVTGTVADSSGSMKVTFFNQNWRERQLPPGTEAIFFGKLELFGGTRQMTNPVVDLVGNRTGRILPVYPQSEKSGLSTWEIGEFVAQVLRRTRARGLADPLADELRDRLGLVDRDSAYRSIHDPVAMSDSAEARRRLVFDELLRIQLALVQRKVTMEHTAVGMVHAVEATDGVAPGLARSFRDRLPYHLTGAQERVIAEIDVDLLRPTPMHRLLQGDVGSGKTLIAAHALLVAVQGGHQGAFMAPTEVLAEQHASGLRELFGELTVGSEASLFEDRPLAVALLTSRTPVAERRRILSGLAAGDIDIAIGTHALLSESVEFRSLGVVVIDEQHRFGVEQRDALRSANADGTIPDVLVMTATPIPRTAAMTVYGDLDVSVLDELPPGRTPIETRRVDSDRAEAAMWDDVRAEIADGRQAYIVCPLVEESAKLEVASATETHDQLATGELAGLRVGLLHGRLSGAEKDNQMSGFRDGRFDALVATTVIEVGVDVPNATVMVILDADRFGIAQLHQLRGRVGRGAAASRCWLVAGAEVTPDAKERLEAMVRTTDGFELAEVDLDLRGEGTLMGDRQKGRNDLVLASLRRDREWVERAREVAIELVGDGHGLDAHPLLVEEVGLFLADGDTDYLLKN